MEKMWFSKFNLLTPSDRKKFRYSNVFAFLDQIWEENEYNTNESHGSFSYLWVALHNHNNSGKDKEDAFGFSDWLEYYLTTGEQLDEIDAHEKALISDLPLYGRSVRRIEHMAQELQQDAEAVADDVMYNYIQDLSVIHNFLFIKLIEQPYLAYIENLKIKNILQKTFNTMGKDVFVSFVESQEAVKGGTFVVKNNIGLNLSLVQIVFDENEYYKLINSKQKEVVKYLSNVLGVPALVAIYNRDLGKVDTIKNLE